MIVSRLSRAGLIAVFLGIPSMAPATELVPRGTYYWNEADGGFGGFSGLAMTAEGGALVTVSDTGWLYLADVTRYADGRISAVSTSWRGRFLDNKGIEVTDFQADAEALAVAADGTVIVSFESYTRISAFHPPDMMPTPLHVWDRFRPFWGNEAFEALAFLPDGHLLAILEEPVDGAYRSLIGRDRDWQNGPMLPADGGYAASDATFGSDGKLYLLERRFALTAGYATRIRRFAYADGAFDGGETLLETAPGELDNMEGISLWRDKDGRTVLTLVSDDNFLPIQNTLLVEYDLVE